MKEIFKLITKSILAGVLIALAGFVFLNVENTIIGSFLFSFGLCLVIILEANLFTGKVGYLSSKRDVLDLVIMLLINMITATLVGVLFSSTLSDEATAKTLEIIAKNYTDYTDGFLSLILNAIGCGICIYCAVEGYKKTHSFIPVILGVMVFIVAGFRHVIADAFYYGVYLSDSSTILNVTVLEGICNLIIFPMVLLLVAVGNAIGSISVRLLQKGWKMNELSKSK